MPLNTHQKVFDLLTGDRCYPVPFPVIVERMRMTGIPFSVARVWINAVARVDAGPALVFRCAVTGQAIARGRPHEAVLAVACPDLPELSDTTADHCCLFVVKNRLDGNPIFFVTLDSVDLLSPYGSTFDHENPLTPALSAWFDASLGALSGSAEVARPEDPEVK